MTTIANTNDLHDFTGELHDSAREIYVEFIEEIKKEHKLTQTNYELEIEYFTTYLYIQKYTYVYITDPDNLKGDTDYLHASDWEDFKAKVKEKAKNLM